MWAFFNLFIVLTGHRSYGWAGMNRGMWGKKLELAVRTLCIRPRQSEVLRKLAEASLVGGGHTRMKKQHGRGKLSARERLSLLYDRGEFIESDQLVSSPSGTPGDGVVTARGKVFGREVIAFSQDFTVSGGTLSAANAKKICKAMDKALELACPIVGINDSGGARIQEGVASLAGYTEVFKRNVQMSGVVPQISLVMGPCAGGAGNSGGKTNNAFVLLLLAPMELCSDEVLVCALSGIVYSPALTDFIVMVRGTSHMFVTGPDVIKEVLHETVTMEALGGARTHTNRSGVAHLASENDVDAIASVRELLSFLPSFWQEKSPIHPISAAQSETDLDPALDTIVPTDPNQPYDMSEVAERILDRGNLFQVNRTISQNRSEHRNVITEQRDGEERIKAERYMYLDKHHSFPRQLQRSYEEKDEIIVKSCKKRSRKLVDFSLNEQ